MNSINIFFRVNLEKFDVCRSEIHKSVAIIITTTQDTIGLTSVSGAPAIITDQDNTNMSIVLAYIK